MPFRREGRPGLIGLAERTDVALAPGSAGSAGVDVSRQLQSLASLTERGMLSDEEFAAAKAKLLA